MALKTKMSLAIGFEITFHLRKLDPQNRPVRGTFKAILTSYEKHPKGARKFFDETYGLRIVKYPKHMNVSLLSWLQQMDRSTRPGPYQNMWFIGDLDYQIVLD